MYCDWNVQTVGLSPNQRESLALEYSKYGYKAIAVTHDCESGAKPISPEKIPKLDLPENVKQLKRVTLTLDDMTSARSVTASNEVLKAYDIVAAVPGDEKVFQYLCEQAYVHVISLDSTSRLAFSFKKPLIQAAIKRGILFEVSYAHALQDTSGRRYFIANSVALVKATHGKNILLSSHAFDPLVLRAPFDVINLGQMVGLSRKQALDALCIKFE